MKEHGLSKEQLFRLSCRTLEKRIRNFYYKTKDDQATIEMLITLQVRNELCEADFSNVLRALVQHIFLKPDRLLLCGVIIDISPNILEQKIGNYYRLNYSQRKHLSLKSWSMSIHKSLMNLCQD